MLQGLRRSRTAVPLVLIAAIALPGAASLPVLPLDVWLGCAALLAGAMLATSVMTMRERATRSRLTATLRAREQELEVARAAQRQVTESRHRLRTIIDTSLNAVITMDAAGAISDWSAQAERTFGWAAAEVCGQQLSEVIIPPRHREAHIAGLARYLATGDGPVLGRVVEVDALRRDGCEIPIELAISPPLHGDLGPTFVAFLRDIGDRRRAERLRELQFSVSRLLADATTIDAALHAVLEQIATLHGWQTGVVWTVDRPTSMLRVLATWSEGDAGNDAFLTASRAMSFAKGTGLPGRVWREGRTVTIANATMDRNFPRATSAVAAGLHSALAVPILSRGEVCGVVEFMAGRYRNLDPESVAVLEDIGQQLGQFLDRRGAEEALAQTVMRLEQLAATDPLTDLRNRREFERALATMPRQDFAILAADVDNLKVINDEYGHEAGDIVLQAIAMTMASLVRGWDVVARIGGDEFAAVLLGISPQQAADAAERMRAAMHSVAVPYGQARLSIGWAYGPAGADPHAVWRSADAQLYTAKKAGRDRVLGNLGDDPRVSPDIENGISGSRWSEALVEVLETRRLTAVYQPIVDMATRSVIGYEALARPDGTGPMESVESLFATAHRSGRMRDLDWLCRRVALAGAPQLERPYALFVNCSAAALLDPIHDVDQLLLVLRWAGRRPEDVVLEITERERIHDIGRLREVLAAYRDHGFRFALDDVGEGHSTIEVLAAANPEYIKVARSLVTTAAASGSRSAIKAAVAFARASGAQVIGEGVETEFTVRQLADLGVLLGQGFLLGPPVTAVAAAGVQPRLSVVSTDCA